MRFYCKNKTHKLMRCCYNIKGSTMGQPIVLYLLNHKSKIFECIPYFSFMLIKFIGMINKILMKYICFEKKPFFSHLSTHKNQGLKRIPKSLNRPPCSMFTISRTITITRSCPTILTKNKT